MRLLAPAVRHDQQRRRIRHPRIRTLLQRRRPVAARRLRMQQITRHRRRPLAHPIRHATRLNRRNHDRMQQLPQRTPPLLARQRQHLLGDEPRRLRIHLVTQIQQGRFQAKALGHQHNLPCIRFDLVDQVHRRLSPQLHRETHHHRRNRHESNRHSLRSPTFGRYHRQRFPHGNLPAPSGCTPARCPAMDAHTWDKRKRRREPGRHLDRCARLYRVASKHARVPVGPGSIAASAATEPREAARLRTFGVTIPHASK